MNSIDETKNMSSNIEEKPRLNTVEEIEARIAEIDRERNRAFNLGEKYNSLPDSKDLRKLYDEKKVLRQVLEIVSEFSLEDIQKELDARDPINDADRRGNEGLAWYSFEILGRAEKFLQHQDKVLQERVDLGEQVIEQWEKDYKSLSWEETEAVYAFIRDKDIPLDVLEEKIRASLIRGSEELLRQLATIGGRRCIKVAEWQDGVDSYVLGNAVNSGEFYFAEVNGKITNSFEYDFCPSKEKVEEDWLNLESERALNRHDELAEGFDIEKELYRGNPDFYRFFYAGQQDADAYDFQKETGWHMIWGSDYQGLNGDTWIVYRDVSDLPGWLREYASEEEQIDGHDEQQKTGGNSVAYGLDDSVLKQEVNDMDYLKVLKEFGLEGGDETFRYQMLSRMKADCEYYLGNGNRHPKYLWADNEKDQISCMKALWLSFPEDKKPEWLTLEQIQDYEKQMVGIEVLFTFGSWEKFPFQMGYVSITAPSVKMAIEEFRRNYPDVNEGVLNCSDYYYREASVAEIKEHGNGYGCHRAIVVSSRDKAIDDVLAEANRRSDKQINPKGKEAEYSKD